MPKKLYQVVTSKEQDGKLYLNDVLVTHEPAKILKELKAKTKKMYAERNYSLTAWSPVSMIHKNHFSDNYCYLKAMAVPKDPNKYMYTKILTIDISLADVRD